MTEHIAIANPLIALPSRRDLLLFDRIAVLGLDEVLRDRPLDETRDLAVLAEKGIVTQPTLRVLETYDDEYVRTEAEDAPAVFTNLLIAITLRAAARNVEKVDSLISRSALRRLAKRIPLPPHTDVELSVHQALRTLRQITEMSPSTETMESYAFAAFNTANIHLVRSTAQNMRVVTGQRVTPLLPRDFGVAGIGRATAVAEIVVRHLPMPSDDVPLDEILRFRADEDASRSLRRLHAWMVQAASGEASPQDLADELNSLIDTYTEYMRIQNMKTRTGNLETFFTIAADVIGNVAKLNLGDAVRALFSVRERQISLLEGELKAPGREVAYVVAARQRFKAGT